MKMHFSFSYRQIRECLKLDQEHKECKKHYTKVKKLVKQLNSAQEFKNNQHFQECVDKAKQILVTEPHEQEYILKANLFLCHCNHKVSSLTRRT